MTRTVLRYRPVPMTVPSLPARFGHRTAPRALILTRVCGDSLSSEGPAGDRDEPRAIAELIYSAGDEERSPVLAGNPPPHALELQKKSVVSVHRDHHASSFSAMTLPAGQFRYSPYAETDCSLAVCWTCAGRHSRRFRTDGALAGSIAASSAALTSAIRPSLAKHLATAMKPSG